MERVERGCLQNDFGGTQRRWRQLGRDVTAKKIKRHQYQETVKWTKKITEDGPAREDMLTKGLDDGGEGEGAG